MKLCHYLAAATMFWIGADCVAGPDSAPHHPEFDKVQIEATSLGSGIYMLAAEGGVPGVTEGGNIGVSVGEDGVFLIDDQFAPMTNKIQAAIAGVTDQPIRFVFNTHWHGDHAGGNESLKKTGALIVAHDRARQRMSTDQFVDLFQTTIPASPKAALPVVTFNDAATFHLNGQTIHAFYVTPAHTDGDVVLHFQEADVIHTGDVYFNQIYPLIDVSGGGDLDGMITAVDEILAIAKDTTQVIPGHGAVSNRAELVTYRNMLAEVSGRIHAAIAQGMSLEEFLASKPTADYDSVWGQSFPTTEVFLSTAYKSLDPTQFGGTSSVDVRVLASYPSGAFLENLEAQPDGRLLFTNYPAKTIEQLSPSGRSSTFAELSAYPLSILSTADGYLVAANGTSLFSGEDATKTQQFLLLDKSGKQVGRIDAPQAMALNGMVRLDNDTVLVADSIAGTIWRVDIKTQAVLPWLRHEALAPLAGQELFKPGANGLKLCSDGLLVSNTSRGTLSLIKIGGDNESASDPKLVASVGMIDDFWVREDGSVLFTTHEASIKSLSRTGEIAVVATEHCLGNTAIVPYPPNQSSSFAVTTDGGIYFGAKDTAKVVLITPTASPKESSQAIAARFFREVWNPPYRVDLIDELMAEDFVITNSGTDIKGRDNFKKWVRGLASQVKNLKVDVEEMMVADDGRRVISRMVATGNNNGVFGTEPDGAPVRFTLISILEVRDGEITHNWVEKSALELHQRLTADQK